MPRNGRRGVPDAAFGHVKNLFLHGNGVTNELLFPLREILSKILANRIREIRS
jgi:hypothetical protein